MKFFFDTNVLVYMFDAGAPGKQETARALFGTHAEAGDILLSTQVLQEFYVTVTRKLDQPLSVDTATEVVTGLAEFPGVQIDNKLVLAAIRRSQTSQLSFWDALIVQTARDGGATTLYSEDMRNGQIMDGVKVVNPFARQPG